MKKPILLAIIIFMVPLTSYGVKPPRANPYEVPQTVPVTIDHIAYITGEPTIMMDKFTRHARIRSRFELGTQDAAFRRTRLKQDGSKKLEDVDILRFRYADIKELYFGKNAIQKAIEGSLPTAAKSVPPLVASSDSTYLVPLDEVLRGRYHSPVIIIHKRGASTISLVFIAHHGRAKALYEVLAREAKLKVLPPVQY